MADNGRQLQPAGAATSKTFGAILPLMIWLIVLFAAVFWGACIYSVGVGGWPKR
jgi:hypothetical protein